LTKFFLNVILESIKVRSPSPIIQTEESLLDQKPKTPPTATSKITDVVRWERVEDFVHGMDVNGRFTGWMRSTGSRQAWNIDTKESVTLAG
jgi:hypothetical protein